MFNAELHRKIVYALAMGLFVVSSILVAVPLLPLFSYTPLMDKFFAADVPMQYQRALVVLLGASGLIGAVLMITFKPQSWYVLMAFGVVGILQGLIAVPAFLPTLANILSVFYLYTIRPLYEPVKGHPAAPSR